MSDNGSAMIAGETRNGLSYLGIQHDKTLPYSPYQNGKQEAFWGALEGRLVAMLTQTESITLERLNYITQAWVEMEYNRKVHEETGQSPLERVVGGLGVARQSPEGDEIDFGFTILEQRVQRRSDGTIQLAGIRMEIPARFSHIKRLSVRYRSWDLTRAWLVDGRSNAILAVIRPLDKTKNAAGKRRAVAKDPLPASQLEATDELPPLLRDIIAEYAVTGLPAAYIPKED
jgi:putative transposase